MNVDGVDLDKLAHWMDSQGLGAGEITNARLLTGGTQNILIRFERSGTPYVFRRPPIHLRNDSNDAMMREARVLAALKGQDVPHPEFIAACADDAVIGATFYLMEPIDGFNAPGCLPEPHASHSEWRWEMGMQMVEAAARLGNLDYKSLGLEGFGRPDGFLDRQVGRWKAQLESYAELQGWPGSGGIPGVDAVSEWLADNKPASFVPGIMHGDYHFNNLMFRRDSPKLAAIVDWELATIGDPLMDLGWIMATWPINGDADTAMFISTPWEGFPEIADLVARYDEVSDKDLTNAKWYGVLGCYKLGILLEGTHARACAGKADKKLGEDFHRRTNVLFSRALNWINE